MALLRHILWRGDDAGPRSWAVPLLLPASALYGLGVALRARRASSPERKKRLPVPVISVGNLVVGGTGKTPMTVWIARELLRAGRRPAVLSRGYGGRAGAGPLVVSDGSRILCGFADAGDEAVMTAVKVRGAPVVVGSDRYRAGLRAVEGFGCDCVILDDGFQHLGLHRDLDILLLDSSRPFGSGRLLPAGTLREAREAVGRADLVVFTRWDQRTDGEREREEAAATSRGTGAAAASHAFVGLRPLRAGDRPSSDRASLGASPAVLALSGIAGPSYFEDTLVRHGFDVRGRMRYPDHHVYSERDMARIARAASRVGASVVVTTEKDEVRLPPGAAGSKPEIYVAEVELRIEEGLDLLLEALERALAKGGSAC